MLKSILFLAILLFACEARITHAKTLRVPTDHASIQSAIDAANHGDTVEVAAGRYLERVVMKDGVTLRSAGDEYAGKTGLRRAEQTIIDGRATLSGPGVTMAKGAILDGFTVTGIGQYDAEKWKHHHATQGKEQDYEHITGPGTPGIAINGVNCIVRHNIVHHIGHTGITISGNEKQECSPLIAHNICYRNMGSGIGSMRKSTATIQNNVCFENFYAGIGQSNSSPFVFNNTCYANIRAGIGISEGASPLVQGNRCFRNRRTGIGARTLITTRPIIKDNDCYENDMAGIGSEEDAAPTICENRCYRNRLAGIGARLHAHPTIIDNECYENGTAGIGQESDSVAIITGNYCHDNKAAGIGFAECTNGRATLTNNRVINNSKVAIGIQAGWKVTATSNELSRVGGISPIVMVFAGSEARFVENEIRGSGVAGIRLSGQIDARCNTFTCSMPRKGGPPNIGIWALKGSSMSISGNTFEGWRDDVRNDAEK